LPKFALDFLGLEGERSGEMRDHETHEKKPKYTRRNVVHLIKELGFASLLEKGGT
jgi:hypothetical protein